MIQLLIDIMRDERAQDLAEYGIAMAVIATGVGAAALAIAADVNALWIKGKNAIAALL